MRQGWLNIACKMHDYWVIITACSQCTFVESCSAAAVYSIYRLTQIANEHYTESTLIVLHVDFPINAGGLLWQVPKTVIVDLLLGWYFPTDTSWEFGIWLIAGHCYNMLSLIANTPSSHIPQQTSKSCSQHAHAWRKSGYRSEPYLLFRHISVELQVDALSMHMHDSPQIWASFETLPLLQTHLGRTPGWCSQHELA